MEGYNDRWEEQWRHTRLIGALLHNANAPAEEKVNSPYEFMPLPSEADLIGFQDFIDSAKFAQGFDLKDQ